METTQTYITFPEVCRRLRIHRTTLHPLVKAGEFPGAIQIRTHWRIPEGDLAAFIKRQTPGIKEAPVKPTKKKRK